MSGLEMTSSEYEVYREEYVGVCRLCGSIQFECEPDARHYTCEDCGAEEVFGIEELLMEGSLSITEDD